MDSHDPLNPTYTLVAAISDIHGNIHALDAVLAEIDRLSPDLIVVCGDVASGPFPRETLDRLMALGGRARFVRGNADRELVFAFDSRLPFDPAEQDPARLFSSWAAQDITAEQRDFLAAFEDRIPLQVTGLGRALFCHASPRNDEEIITAFTPEPVLRRLLAGLADIDLVVIGHTHHQFDRTVSGVRPGSIRLANAGSLGMPYEGQPGAYWALLGPGVEPLRTPYDAASAAREALAAGYPDPSYPETLLTPPSPAEVAAYFEQVAAERGERD